MSRANIPIGRILTAFGIVTAGIWFATQWAATQLPPGVRLGTPWFESNGFSVHPPWRVFGWWMAHADAAPRVFDVVALMLIGSAVLAALVAMAMSAWSGRNAKTSTLHGSARWAGDEDVVAAGLLANRGVMLGLHGGRYLRHAGPEHVLAFAPTRSGKGVGLVVPTLLGCTDSVVVHDIKGEHWQLSSGWRSRFSHCLRFDPTDVRSAAYNPLLEVRRGELEVRDVQNIADVLVDPEGALERRSHWEKTSHALLVGAILHVLYAEPDKSLRGVAAFLSDPARPFERTLAVMMRTAHLGDRPHPVVAAAAREMLNRSDNERSGVLSTAMSFLGLFHDPVVAAVTSRCDWRIADLVHGAVPVSLYLVVPPSDLSRTRPLVRLLLNQIGRRLTEGLPADISGAASHPLLWVLDEFPALGRLDFFEQALAFMAGYRMRALLVAQSLNQIEHAYGANSSILDNCHVRVAFAPNDERTARRLSEALGTATEVRTHRSFGGDRGSLWLGHVTESLQSSPRSLLLPAEAMQLPADEAIVMVGGHPPVRAKKLRYYEDRNFARRVFPPPVLAEGGYVDRPPARPDDWTGRVVGAPADLSVGEAGERIDDAPVDVLLSRARGQERLPL